MKRNNYEENKKIGICLLCILFTIEGMFSTYAKNHIKDFDEKVEELIHFMEGDIQSVEAGVMGGSSSSGEDMYRSVTILVEIKTDQDKYEIQFFYD